MVKRDSYWDSLKFVLIFIVVYGHVLAIDNEDGSVNRAVFNLIFCFHMPLFIFVSGRFSQVNDEKRYKIGILKLSETYIVFQILHILRRLVVGKGVFTLPHILIYQEVTLWYLLCLIYWRLIVVLIFKHSVKSPKLGGAILLFSFAISLLSGFIPIEGEFSFQRACSFWPFFVMGYYSKNVDVKKILDNKLGFLVAVFGILSIFILIYLFFNRDLPILSGTISYIADGLLDKELIVGRVLFIIVATALSAFVIRLVKSNQTLSNWGRYTLFIYIYHMFFIACLNRIVNLGWFPVGFVAMLIYSVVLTMLLVWMSRIKVLNIVLNPISYFLSTKR